MLYCLFNLNWLMKSMQSCSKDSHIFETFYCLDILENANWSEKTNITIEFSAEKYFFQPRVAKLCFSDLSEFLFWGFRLEKYI